MRLVGLFLLLFIPKLLSAQLYFENSNKTRIKVYYYDNGKKIWEKRHKMLKLHLKHFNPNKNDDEKIAVESYTFCKYIAVPSSAGLLIFSREKGKLLYRFDQNSSYMFDRTNKSKFFIETDKGKCEGDAKNGLFVAECNNLLFFVNGKSILCLSMNKLKPLAEIKAKNNFFVSETKIPDLEFHFEHELFKMKIFGRVLLR